MRKVIKEWWAVWREELMWMFVILFMMVALPSFYVLYLTRNYTESEWKEPICHSTGVTVIEYGVGVTNCGDTIAVKMPGELYKEFKEAN